MVFLKFRGLDFHHEGKKKKNRICNFFVSKAFLPHHSQLGKKVISLIFYIPGIPAPAIPEENVGNPKFQQVWDWVLFHVWFYPHFGNYSFPSGFSQPIIPFLGGKN